MEVISRLPRVVVTQSLIMNPQNKLQPGYCIASADLRTNSYVAIII